MVNSRTIVRVLIEVLGEIIAASGAFILIRDVPPPILHIVLSIFFLFLGIGMRIYGDDLSKAIYEGTLKEKLSRWN